MHLTKHHGLGNDFLIWLAGSADSAPDEADLPERARAWCDRRRGIGADGLIVGIPGGDADVAMILHNTDGGRAEMSGNGIRCLAQAVARDRRVDTLELDVSTDAGVRHCSVRRGRAGVSDVTVDMGPVVVRAAGEGRPRAVTVDVGNPHLVLFQDGDPLDLAELGRARPDLNVEIVRSVADGIVVMDVWERGVGRTEACGTGAVAVAAASTGWGLTGERVTVRMPGGDVAVGLGDATATLTGPATFVATVEPWESR